MLLKAESYYQSNEVSASGGGGVVKPICWLRFELKQSTIFEIQKCCVLASPSANCAPFSKYLHCSGSQPPAWGKRILIPTQRSTERLKWDHVCKTLIKHKIRMRWWWMITLQPDVRRLEQMHPLGLYLLLFGGRTIIFLLFLNESGPFTSSCILSFCTRKFYVPFCTWKFIHRKGTDAILPFSKLLLCLVSSSHPIPTPTFVIAWEFWK